MVWNSVACESGSQSFQKFSNKFGVEFKQIFQHCPAMWYRYVHMLHVFFLANYSYVTRRHISYRIYFFGGEALQYDIQTEMVNFKVWPSKVTVPNNHRKVTWTRQGPMIFVLRYFGGLSVTVVRWWFQIFLIFIPIWGNDPIWIFQMDWNHQLGQVVFSIISVYQ